MKYTYKASDLRPGEGMLSDEHPEPVSVAWMHRIALESVAAFEQSHPGDRALMLSVNLTVSMLYVPASVALPAKKKGRK